MSSDCREELRRFFITLDKDGKSDIKVSEIFSMGFTEWNQVVGISLREYAKDQGLDVRLIVNMMRVINNYAKETESKNEFECIYITYIDRVGCMHACMHT